MRLKNEKYRGYTLKFGKLEDSYIIAYVEEDGNKGVDVFGEGRNKKEAFDDAKHYIDYLE